MPVGWKPKRVHKVIAGKEGITIKGGRTMNNTKWNEIFRAFYYDMECLKRIHVPGTVENGVATVYGYRTDVDYI